MDSIWKRGRATPGLEKHRYWPRPVEEGQLQALLSSVLRSGTSVEG